MKMEDLSLGDYLLTLYKWSWILGKSEKSLRGLGHLRSTFGELPEEVFFLKFKIDAQFWNKTGLLPHYL